LEKLHYINGRLELHLDELKIYTEFVTGKAEYRRKTSGRKQALARAVGIKPNKTLPKIIDATAGLGQDAFVLANLGCELTLLERSNTIYQLLSDGLKRATEHLLLSNIINKIQLIEANAITWLAENKINTDVIYIDPMFPPRTKSALVKKEMRVLKQIVGMDLDADKLLLQALKYNCKRVVVKRPKNAEYLNMLEPSFIIKTKNMRFDIYLT
jgi:16S rRNA (guanine1516-N2)-methyltransferase